MFNCITSMMKRLHNYTITFDDYPEFRPNLTPAEIFEQGAFGGTYWRPIYSSVTGKNYKNKHRKYKFLDQIPEDLLSRSEYDVSINKYKVRSGTTLEFWESKGWIVSTDPYGWVQWYSAFYNGRRSDDDRRQINRWLAFAGPNGRFFRRLVNMINQSRKKYNDVTVSPVIRQGLHHWAKKITLSDV